LPGDVFMKRDFKAWMMTLIFGLPVFLILFIAFLYFGNCGFNNDCSQSSQAALIHTPIATILPATMPARTQNPVHTEQKKCTASADTLLAAWVDNGYSDTVSFIFSDSQGATCQASFSQIQVLFTESNLWYSGALACISCHHADISTASARMDLSSYAGIVAGSRRTSEDKPGNNILGDGNWQKSKLREMLFVLKKMPFGRPEGAVAEAGPVIQVGNQVVANSTPTSIIPVEEVPRPSNPGQAGTAIDLQGDAIAGAELFEEKCSVCHGKQGLGNVPNPGSLDGTIPP